MQNPIIQEMRLLDSDLLAHVHSVDSLVGASEQVSAVRIQFKVFTCTCTLNLRRIVSNVEIDSMVDLKALP